MEIKKIKLADLEQQAQENGCKTSKHKHLLIATDYKNVMLATEEGKIRFDILEITNIIKQLEGFTLSALQEVNKMRLEEISSIAKEKGISYGELKAAIQKATLPKIIT